MREAQGFGQFAEVARQQGDACHVHGYVATGAHGDAEVGLCQGGAVVDAVAHHGYGFALVLQAGDERSLFLRQHAGVVVADACLGGDGAGSGFVVARQQVDFDALTLQGGDGRSRGRLDAVGNGSNGQCFVFVGQPDDGLRFGRQSFGFFLQLRADTDTLFGQQTAVAGVVEGAAYRAADTPSGEAFKLPNWRNIFL